MSKPNEPEISCIINQKQYEDTMHKLDNICNRLKKIAELQNQMYIPENTIAVLNNPKKLILRTDLVVREEDRRNQERKLSRRLGVDVVILPAGTELIAAESE